MGALLLLGTTPSASRAGDHHFLRVISRDGTPIAVECAGSGPELLIVHGGTGDRTRWSPMFPYLEKDWTVCMMDRRAHGESGDGADYSLAREAEDVAAVASSRGRPVAVLGHSFGGVAAYEAAFLTPSITSLLLYEPPLRNPDHAATLAKMNIVIQAGNREAATTIFMRDVVGIGPDELAAMRARPSWPTLVSSIGTSIRQDQALSAYRWDAARARTLHEPVLLLLGGRTTSPGLRRAIQDLADSLPDRELVILDGQEHNAMDSDRKGLADVIRKFLSARIAR